MTNSDIEPKLLEQDNILTYFMFNGLRWVPHTELCQGRKAELIGDFKFIWKSIKRSVLCLLKLG